MFEEAIATTKEYVVDKKSWAAPFQATVEGTRWKKMEGGDLWDGILQQMKYSSILVYILLSYLIIILRFNLQYFVHRSIRFNC